MKTMNLIKTIVIIILMINTLGLYSQSSVTGKWEGSFMGDFKTLIEFTGDSQELSGKIQMFSGENMIQNDQLTKVNVNGTKLTFFIEAKDTRFEGDLTNNYSVLSGYFIFPDQTKHPIELNKNTPDQQSMEDSKAASTDIENTNYSQKDLVEDVNYLVNNLKQYHPKLYAFSSEHEFEKNIDALTQNIENDLSLFEFYYRIAMLLDDIECSHTGAQLPLSLQKKQKDTGNFIPLNLVFTNGKAYCIENFDLNSCIQPGDEILSINNQTIESIQKKLFAFFPAEGNNLSSKEYYINREFNYYFNLIDNSSRFEVEFVNNNGEGKEILDACKYEQVAPKMNLSNTSYQFIFDKSSSTGYLTIPSFGLQEINQYIEDMDHVFSLLQTKQSKNLVLDLRGNTGGHPIFAAQLFSYLTTNEFTWFARNNDIQEFEPLYNAMQPNRLNFSGNVYVLIDGGCLSTTGHLIYHLSKLSNTIFVGQEPGSTLQCNDFSFKTTLPNTQIEVNIPRTSFVAAAEQKMESSAFKLDYEIPVNVENIIIGEDSALNFIENKLIIAGYSSR